MYLENVKKGFLSWYKLVREGQYLPFVFGTYYLGLSLMASKSWSVFLKLYILM